MEIVIAGTIACGRPATSFSPAIEVGLEVEALVEAAVDPLHRRTPVVRDQLISTPPHRTALIGAAETGPNRHPSVRHDQDDRVSVPARLRPASKATIVQRKLATDAQRQRPEIITAARTAGTIQPN